ATLILAGGLALAAIQIAPMLELGALSGRVGRIPYEFNLEYAFPPFNVITFLFPYFFVTPAWTDWGLWGRGEIAVYAGLLPTALALLLPPAFVLLNSWVMGHPGATAEGVARWYLALPRAQRELKPEAVASFLAAATDLRGARPASQLGLLAVSAVVLVGAAL